MKIIKNNGEHVAKDWACKYLFESTFKGKKIYASANLCNLLSLPFVKLGLVKPKRD
jgi:hypothetical protein